MTPVETAEHYVGMLDDHSRLEIQKLQSANPSVEALWQAYGKRLGELATGEEPEQRARKAFKERLSELRRALCESDNVQAVIKDPAVASQFDLAAVLAGKLLESRFGGVNLVVIAVLVSRIGLNKICSGEDL